MTSGPDPPHSCSRMGQFWRTVSRRDGQREADRCPAAARQPQRAAHILQRHHHRSGSSHAHLHRGDAKESDPGRAGQDGAALPLHGYGGQQYAVGVHHGAFQRDGGAWREHQLCDPTASLQEPRRLPERPSGLLHRSEQGAVAQLPRPAG